MTDDIPVHESVQTGRCAICGATVLVPPTLGDTTGIPMPASSMPENPVLVRMCDECREDFVRWKAEADVRRAGGPARRSDA